MMLRGVRDDDPMRVLAAVKSSVLWMFAMIFTYAIFIPNTWRRAAKLIVPHGAGADGGSLDPGTGSSRASIRWPFARPTFEKISEDGLFLLLGAFTAIFGTHIINTLADRGVRGQAAEPVPAGPQARRRRDGRGLSWRSTSCSSGPAPSS